MLIIDYFSAFAIIDNIHYVKCELTLNLMPQKMTFK